MAQEQEVAESNVVHINGKDYKQDEMSGDQQYLIAQLRDLQQKADQLRFQLDQVSASQKVFTEALIESVEAPAEEAAAEATG